MCGADVLAALAIVSLAYGLTDSCGGVSVEEGCGVSWLLGEWLLGKWLLGCLGLGKWEVVPVAIGIET